MKIEDPFEGIDKNKAHPNALKLLKQDFFWDRVDELSPFGSDEGDMALREFRQWRKENPEIEVGYCIAWIINSVGQIKDYDDYNEENLVNKKLIKEQIDNPDFDDQHYIYTLDTSIIATALGQLVDEGFIEEDYKYFVQVAINRQKIWTKLNDCWEHKDEYIKRLLIIEKVLQKA
ncbi:hypothetical protein [Flavobacterium piscis]|uniref:Uncharacterized protein YfeS n=1 Tax=Flavobacterium piscis TaxID=1114874 RepID=A0ABU1YAG4_9FLAO|nr:hypothetical protein [Flavobacterium piscis]MDR7211235.1 uncharacterized protein YfeS [Flavobacterium piscis]